MKACPDCGHSCGGNAPRCPKCGHEFGAEPEPMTTGAKLVAVGTSLQAAGCVIMGVFWIVVIVAVVAVITYAIFS